MIAAFIVDKMSAYIAGGMNPETAAHFMRGELGAIYQGNHFTRDESEVMHLTPLPEKLDIESAMRKADAAIMEIIKNYPSPKAPENPRNVYRSSDAIKHAIGAGIGIKEFFAKSKDNDPSAYTTDMRKISAWWGEGQRRFKAFIRGKFLVMDIDRKPGKPDGLEAFYRIFPRETLPTELQGLPDTFSCYSQTPSGGFHLFFSYAGPELKLRELAPGVEVKEWQITTPGSRRENGEYILRGELSNAPPLFGLIIDGIEEAKRRKERAKAERSRPQPHAAANSPIRYAQPRITLDALADEASAVYGGHHDRQVSFAGRACRCKFSVAETLAYVKSRPYVFGNGSDTESAIFSVFRDNGGRP